MSKKPVFSLLVLWGRSALLFIKQVVLRGTAFLLECKLFGTISFAFLPCSRFTSSFFYFLQLIMIKATRLH